MRIGKTCMNLALTLCIAKGNFKNHGVFLCHVRMLRKSKENIKMENSKNLYAGVTSEHTLS